MRTHVTQAVPTAAVGSAVGGRRMGSPEPAILLTTPDLLSKSGKGGPVAGHVRVVGAVSLEVNLHDLLEQLDRFLQFALRPTSHKTGAQVRCQMSSAPGRD